MDEEKNTTEQSEEISRTKQSEEIVEPLAPDQPGIPPAGTVIESDEEKETVYPDNWPTPEAGPSAQDDTDAMMVDHEYRLTMLELGLNV